VTIGIVTVGKTSRELEFKERSWLPLGFALSVYEEGQNL
jgi:hypothetical protein